MHGPVDRGDRVTELLVDAPVRRKAHRSRGHDPRPVALLDEAQVLLHQPPGGVDRMEITGDTAARSCSTIGEPRIDQIERLLGPGLASGQRRDHLRRGARGAAGLSSSSDPKLPSGISHRSRSSERCPSTATAGRVAGAARRANPAPARDSPGGENDRHGAHRSSLFTPPTRPGANPTRPGSAAVGARPDTLGRSISTRRGEPMAPIADTAQGQVEGSEHDGRVPLRRHPVRQAAGRRAAAFAARAARAWDGVRDGDLASAASAPQSAITIDVLPGMDVGRARVGGLPLPERVRRRRRRRAPAGDGVDPRRRLHDRLGLAVALRRRRARAPRRRRGRDASTTGSARSASSHLARPRRRACARSRQLRACSTRSRRSSGCATTSRRSAAIPATSRSSASRRAA